MNRILQIRPLARLEIIEAATWYSEQGHGLADRFMEALNAALLRIQDNPLQYPVVHGELRRAGLRRFPYAVVFSVLDTQVIVLGCIHGRRDPRRWMRRT